jgi:aspartate/methionine/tyrosine aminotransferase
MPAPVLAKTARFLTLTIALTRGNAVPRPKTAGAFVGGARAEISSSSCRRTINMSAAASSSTSDRVRQTLDPCVILMKEIISRHAEKWEDRGGIYSLAQGVVYWKPPDEALEAIATAAISDDTLHTYCPDEGTPELRSALAGKLATENGLGDVNVIVTSGANQAYVNTVLTLLSEGDKCVVFRPYYFNHVMAIQMTRGERSLLVGPTGDDGVPDLDWLKAQVEEDRAIKVVTIVNPGNPTGTSLPRAYLEEAVDLCEQFGIWLVMDCTYEHFDHTSANGAAIVSEDIADIPAFWCSSKDHVINIFSFSKAFALAGFRVGYVAINKSARGDEAYEHMLKVQDTIPICPARVSQIAALAAIDAGREWVAERVQTLDGGRQAILDALSPLEKIMGGTGAMYVMAKLPEGMDDKQLANALVESYGVAVIPGSFCGYPNWIRVCYSNLPPEQCKDAASRLATGIKELCVEQN